MKNVKIIRIITRLNIGGPAQHAIFLTRSMQGDHFKTTLTTGVCGRGEVDMMYLAKELGVEPIVVREMSREVNPLKDLAALFRIYKIIKKEKPDIVHTHTAKAGTLGRLASILAGKAIRVHTFHGHSLEGYFGRIKNLVFAFIEKILARFTDRIIVLSKKQRDDLSQKYHIADQARFSIINLGLDLERFLQIGDAHSGKFRIEYNIDEEAVLIGIVGRLVEIKNHRMFLDAVKKIQTQAREKNYRFVIVGDGHLKSRLIEYARKSGILDLIRFTGWYKNIWEVYEDLDIVTLTSLNEGTPVSLIQAMASLRSVVATDVGGVESVVLDGKNGYIVRSGDTDDFSNKVLDLAQSAEKRKIFGQSGREYVRNKFSEERLTRDLENLYVDLVEGQKGK